MPDMLRIMASKKRRVHHHRVKVSGCWLLKKIGVLDSMALAPRLRRPAQMVFHAQRLATPRTQLVENVAGAALWLQHAGRLPIRPAALTHLVAGVNVGKVQRGGNHLRRRPVELQVF